MDVSGAVWESYKVCDVCYEVVKHNMTTQGGPESIKMLEDWGRHIKSASCKKFGTNRSHKGNGAPSGTFAFTLTKSPTDPQSIGDMLSAARKVMSQKTCRVVKYAWYYEDKGTDESGEPIHPHIHGVYETEKLGRIPARQFERAWPLWDEKVPLGAGFRGGYHRPVKQEDEYLEYIKKQGRMGEQMGY